MKRLLNYAVLLLPIILPLYVFRFNIGPLPTTVLEIYILLLIGLWATYRVGIRSGVSRSTIHVPRSWRWPVLAWIFATLIAVAIAPDHWGAFGHWRAFVLEPVLVFIAINDLFNTTPYPSSLRRGVMFGIGAVTIALGVYAVIQYFTGWGIPSPWDAMPGRRATGIFGYPNGLSLFVAPFGVVCFMEWIKRVWDGDKQSPRLFFLAGTAAALMAELLAKSMGGILALGIGMALVLIIKKETRKIGYALCAVGAIVAIVIAARIYNTQLHPLNIGDNIATSKKWSSMVRTVIWQESAQIIKDHPLMGTGLRSYPTAILPYHKATWMEVFPHPHNIVLMLWIETGLLGLLAFAWICWTWVSVISGQWLVASRGDGHKSLNTDHLLFVVPLVVILIHGMVDMPYFKNDLAVQFWLLAALATTASLKYHHEDKLTVTK